MMVESYILGQGAGGLVAFEAGQDVNCKALALEVKEMAVAGPVEELEGEVLVELGLKEQIGGGLRSELGG